MQNSLPNPFYTTGTPFLGSPGQTWQTYRERVDTEIIPVDREPKNISVTLQVLDIKGLTLYLDHEVLDVLQDRRFITRQDLQFIAMVYPEVYRKIREVWVTAATKLYWEEKFDKTVASGTKAGYIETTDDTGSSYEE